MGDPPGEFPFTHCLPWPKEVPIFRYLGGKLERLNNVRAEFRSFIWHDKAMVCTNTTLDNKRLAQRKIIWIAIFSPIH